MYTHLKYTYIHTYIYTNIPLQAVRAAQTRNRWFGHGETFIHAKAHMHIHTHTHTHTCTHKNTHTQYIACRPCSSDLGSSGSGVGMYPPSSGLKKRWVSFRPKTIGNPSARHSLIGSTSAGTFLF